MHSSDNCYGTDTVPLPSRFFVAAFTFSPFGTKQTWPTPGSSLLASHSTQPAFLPSKATVQEAVRSTAADVRINQTLAHATPTQPADDDVDMNAPTIEGEIVYPEDVEAAFTHLLYSLDHPPFTLQEEHYDALSQLPLTYPWTSITIDLKEYVPFLERHLVTHLVAGRCQLISTTVEAHTVLDVFLRSLADAIVNGIFSFHSAKFPAPPHIPPVLFTPRFWHAHLNYACNRAVSPTGGTGTLDNMAGDQLAIWNQVNHRSNLPIPSTHLTIFVPPAMGAYILSNINGTADNPPQLKPTPPSQPSLSPVLTVSQPFNLPLPLVFPQNEEGIMTAARAAAADGHVRYEAIPFLGVTDESFYHRKLQWTLRFPMPPPATSSSTRRFSSTVVFRQGPHSAEALDGALRLATPFSYANASTHILFNSPFMRLPDIESILGHPRLDPMSTLPLPQDSIRQWLFDGAPRIIPQRLRKLNPVPKAFVDFFTDNIRLPQLLLLIQQGLCEDDTAISQARKDKRHFPAADFLRAPHPNVPVFTIAASAPSAPAVPSGEAAAPPPTSLPTTSLLAPCHPSPPRPSPPSSSSSAPHSSTHHTHTPPFSKGSDHKRPRLPYSKASASSSAPPPQFSGQTWRPPIGYARPPTPKTTASGPYQPQPDKGKGKNKGQGHNQGKGKGKGFKGPPIVAPPPAFAAPPRRPFP